MDWVFGAVLSRRTALRCGQRLGWSPGARHGIAVRVRHARGPAQPRPGADVPVFAVGGDFPKALVKI